MSEVVDSVAVLISIEVLCVVGVWFRLADDVLISIEVLFNLIWP